MVPSEVMSGMRRLTRAFIVLAAASTPGAAVAQEPAPTPVPVPSPAPDTRPELRLSLEDAVKRTLENNTDIAVERYNPEDSAEQIKEVVGNYDFFLTGFVGKESRTDPPRNAFAGGDKVDTDTWTYDVGATKLFGTGATLALDFNNTRSTTNNVFSTFNPSFGSSFDARLTQPLLKNFKIDSTRQALRVAKKNKEISDVQFKQTVINTVATIKQLYYDLIFAMDNLSVANKSLALARKLLDENQIKVKVGTLAPLDVVAAESEVASRAEGVIVAESAMRDAEDNIRRVIFPRHEPENWAVRIVPTDRPSADPVPVDVETAIRNALANRTDVLASRKNIENAEIGIQFAKNQTLPGVDLVGAYGVVGLGGTQVRDAFGDPLPNPIPGGAGDALSSLFGRDFPTWTLGVNLSYPIPNRTARATAARARLSRDQAQAALARLEMQVVSEVRSAARAVETDMKRIDSTRAARVLQERRLDAEEKKFAAGMSTSFLVTQAQRDLAVAEAAEIQAISDYRKDVVSYERVQEAGLGSIGGTGITLNTRAGIVSTQGSTIQ
jgi:outer membrane protein TolC